MDSSILHHLTKEKFQLPKFTTKEFTQWQTMAMFRMIDHPIMRNIVATDPATGRNIMHPYPSPDLNRKLYIAIYQSLPSNLQSLHATDADNARTDGTALWSILTRKYGKTKQHFADVSELINQYETINKDPKEK